MKRRLQNDSGFVSASAALSFGILFIGVASMAVVAHASVETSAAAKSAAQGAARAASRQQTPAGARAAAEDALDANTVTESATCAIETFDVGTMAPGEPINVVVDCKSIDAGFGPYTTLGRTYQGEATEIIDAFRTGEVE